MCALPGRVDHPMARGCHRLIREGATLVEDPEEVLIELGLAQAVVSSSSDGPRSRNEPLPSIARDLLATLQGETLSPDELAERTKHDVASVLTSLVELELGGRVVRGAGALYRLA